MIKDTSHKHRNNPNRMSDAENYGDSHPVSSGGFRCFKHYYQEYVCKHLCSFFNHTIDGFLCQ